jgi:hypothetical protein
LRTKERSMKTCGTCRMTKDDECFWKNKAKPDGLDNMCVACRRLYNLLNRRKINRRKREYRVLHREAAR